MKAEPMRPSHRTAARRLLLASLLAFAPAPALAGGGPETTVVVVNGDSPLSLRLANEYAHLRRLPPGRICILEDVPAGPVIGVEAFRERIWKPVRAFLETRGLLDRADVIAYSCDFPYGVDFAADKAPPYAQGVSPVASLTSLTYLARRVERKDADGYLDLAVNRYFRRYSGGGTAGGGARRPTSEEARRHSEATAALQAKDYAKAAEAYRALLATLPEHTESWYNLACCLALTGKADEALAALGQAADRGWSDVGHTEKDADLESLRARPEFAAILVRMKKAAAVRASVEYAVQPAHGFAARRAWTGEADPAREAATDSLDRYWLATMLAYTFERGNSLPEALAYLGAAAKSDGTSPDGTVYFLRNDDIRSKTREPLFATAASALRKMGRRAAILSQEDAGQTGVLPVGKADVIGAVAGIAGFDWPGSQSRLLPGAIAEHLTSFGAHYATAGQTKISEFLRAGAAGSAGAVAEPFALQQKFPTPHLHVFYAEGCSLAEAFYQSVQGPYQLLVVGDPLARPFAKFASVSLAAPDPAKPWSGRVDLLAELKPAPERPIARVELWVDGAWIAEAAPGAAIAWDSASVEDGMHDLRLVAVEAGRIETRSFAVARVTVKNGAGAPVTVQPVKGRVKYGDAIALAGVAPGAKEVVVQAAGREVARAPVKGGAWKCAVPTAAVGLGPVVLQVRSVLLKGGGATSPMLDVTVDPPAPRAAPKPAPAYEVGLFVAAIDAAGKPQTFEVRTLDGDELEKALEGKVAAGAREVRFEGEFEVAAAGLYQLYVQAAGAVKFTLDGAVALDRATAPADRLGCGPASLAAGRHSLGVGLRPTGAPERQVMLGGDQPTAPLEGKALRHRKKGK